MNVCTKRRSGRAWWMIRRCDVGKEQEQERSALSVYGDDVPGSPHCLVPVLVLALVLLALPQSLDSLAQLESILLHTMPYHITPCTPSNYTKWFLDQCLARAYSSARGPDLRSHASSFASVQLRALRCARSQQFELDVSSSPAAIDLASLPSNHASQPKRLPTLCHTVPAMCILVCCFIHTSLLHYSSSSPTNPRGPCGPASLTDQRSSYRPPWPQEIFRLNLPQLFTIESHEIATCFMHSTIHLLPIKTLNSIKKQRQGRSSCRLGVVHDPCPAEPHHRSATDHPDL